MKYRKQQTLFEFDLHAGICHKRVPLLVFGRLEPAQNACSNRCSRLVGRCDVVALGNLTCDCG